MNRIKEVLLDQGRTQQWLAARIGKSYVVTTNYCNNKTQPSAETLEMIALILEVKVSDLLPDTEEMEGLSKPKWKRKPDRK